MIFCQERLKPDLSGNERARGKPRPVVLLAWFGSRSLYTNIIPPRETHAARHGTDVEKGHTQGVGLRLPQEDDPDGCAAARRPTEGTRPCSTARGQPYAFKGGAEPA